MLTCSTYSSAAVTKEKCLAADQYWSNNSCSPAFNACNELATYKRPFRNKGALQNLSDPPQTFCYFDNELNTVPYDGCQMKQSGSINKLRSGSWQSDYVFTGKPCNKGIKNADGSITPTPREDIKKPEFEDVFQSSKQQTCRVSNAYVDSTKQFHEMPQKVWSTDACTMKLISQIGKNSINNCIRYKYSGSNETPPVGSYSIDDLLKNSATCSYKKRLNCSINERPSRDGSTCVKNNAGLDSSTTGTLVTSNPYILYKQTQISYTTYVAGEYVKTSTVNYIVPSQTSNYIADILKEHLDSIKVPDALENSVINLKDSGSVIYEYRGCRNPKIEYKSRQQISGDTVLLINQTRICDILTLYRNGRVHSKATNYRHISQLAHITLKPVGYDYKIPTKDDEKDSVTGQTGAGGGSTTTPSGGGTSSECDPSKFVCSNDNYLKNISNEITSLARDAKKLREGLGGSESDNTAILDSLSSNLTTAVTGFFSDSDKTIDGLNKENTSQGNDLIKKASPVLTGVTDKIGKLFKVDTCEPINLSFGEKKIYVTCEDLKPLRDFLSWAFIVLTLIYIYQYFLERSAK